jgi:DNA-binding MarR family transcriptional regulator
MSQEQVESRVGYLVKRVQQRFRQLSDELLRPLGLSIAQYAVLRALADHPGASSAELARLCFVTRQSLQDVLGGLRKAELVVVSDEATVGRSRPVRLTPAGRRALRAADRVILRIDEQMLSGISARDQQTLARLLGTCAGNLDG